MTRTRGIRACQQTAKSSLTDIAHRERTNEEREKKKENGNVILFGSIFSIFCVLLLHAAGASIWCFRNVYFLFRLSSPSPLRFSFHIYRETNDGIRLLTRQMQKYIFFTLQTLTQHIWEYISLSSSSSLHWKMKSTSYSTFMCLWVDETKIFISHISSLEFSLCELWERFRWNGSANGMQINASHQCGRV